VVLAVPCVVLQVGKDKMHFRPPEEQNDHKVTCGVSTAVLQRVLDSVQQRLDSEKVQANIITSGTGMAGDLNRQQTVRALGGRGGKLHASRAVACPHVAALFRAAMGQRKMRLSFSFSFFLFDLIACLTT
jgi:hypothetical protein